jgi:hypothetical protein
MDNRLPPSQIQDALAFRPVDQDADPRQFSPNARLSGSDQTEFLYQGE